MTAPNHHFPENRFVFMSLGPDGPDISIDEEATTEEIVALCGLMLGATLRQIASSEGVTIREAADFISEQVKITGEKLS